MALIGRQRVFSASAKVAAMMVLACSRLSARMALSFLPAVAAVIPAYNRHYDRPRHGHNAAAIKDAPAYGLTVHQANPISAAAYWHSAIKTAKTLQNNKLLSNANAAMLAAKRVIMAKLKFRPLHDRVVVKRIDAEEKTKGGIIIPDTAKEKPQEGEVVAVGPGGRDENGKLIPIDIKAGDRVLFGKWSGTEVKIDGDELLIMKESDIMGVIA